MANISKNLTIEERIEKVKEFVNKNNDKSLFLLRCDVSKNSGINFISIFSEEHVITKFIITEIEEFATFIAVMTLGHEMYALFKIV